MRTKEKWRVLARHKRWVWRTCITESVNSDSTRRKFTAAINGWGNFKIWEGEQGKAQEMAPIVQDEVKKLRERMDAGDETVFSWKTKL